MTVTILKGDCRDILRTLPAESVHCVVTSPPYWGLRDYGIDGQLGLEPTPDAYVAAIVEIFREVRRMLRKDGTLWLNLGDSYAGGGNAGGGSYDAERNWRRGNSEKNRGQSNRDGIGRISGLKPKDLIGIPWRVAFALQVDGWYLRQDIVWSKPNPMPESITDRCTKAHEYIFLLSKSERYYYDQEAIMEPVTDSTIDRLSQPTLDQQEGSWRVPGKTNGPMKAALPKRAFKAENTPRHDGNRWNENDGRGFTPTGLTRNKRSVWEVTTQPFREAHFATFPPALIEPCILAGCPKQCCAKCGAPWVRMQERSDANGRTIVVAASERHARDIDGRPLMGDNMVEYGVRGSFNVGNKGTAKRNDLGFSPSCSCNAGVIGGGVLDPFGGAGTTGLVADRLQRNAILIELNPEYAAMAERRIKDDAPLFAQLELQLSQQSDDYDAVDDFGRSIDECYAEIRERKAKGGKGWGGWGKDEV